MKHFTHIGFVVFLIIYSIFKYQAVPELMGQPAYIKSTAILVVLTAILPYFISFFIKQKMIGSRRMMVAALLPLILCFLGLAIYFYLFIAPNAPDLSVTKVLPRAIVPGLVMGAILALPQIMHRKN